MLLSLSWLREFVPYEGTAAELGDRLTMTGLELDGLEKPFEALRPLVVGLVAECGPHPEADRLSVCRVDVGDEVLDIVCGAPNVAKGQKVPVVRVGGMLPTGLVVKKTRLRGMPSHGMICSEAELGLSEDHAGIMVLDASIPVGISLLNALNLDEEVLNIAVTPNRGDCLSVLGLAREVSAIMGLPLVIPTVEHVESGSDATNALALDIARPDLCPLYHGRIIEGVATAQSPRWLRFRLRAAGVRAISNLVDVTNYILLELGQPLHAFDLDSIRGKRIIVREADEGERFTTLDGQERILGASDITIRDAEGIIALGGVMGGLDSEITAASSRVFLESAVFHPSHIRRTARRLNLHSEAAYRFERGVDQPGATFALERATHMMAALSGGFARPGVIKAEPLPWRPSALRLRQSRTETLLGISFDPAFYSDTLARLGCTVEKVETAAHSHENPASSTWHVIAPSWRHDLTREADLIEELARIYGVNRIPPILPGITRDLKKAGEPEPLHSFLLRVKYWGRAAGLHESISYSFVSHKDLDHLGIPQNLENGGRISILNPLSDDLNVLRTHLAPGLLHALRVNLAQGAPCVRLFEVASAFTADASSETTVHEAMRLGILMHGTGHEQPWPQPARDLDYLDIKGIIEHLCTSFSLPEASFSLTDTTTALPWLNPCVAVSIGDKPLGFAGRVKPDLASPYHAKKAVWIAEIDLDALHSLQKEIQIRFVPLPTFPPVRRDITFIAPFPVTAGNIAKTVRDMCLPLLVAVQLIDYFDPEGRKERNLTFRLTFRHIARTLKDAEADKQRKVVAEHVQKKLGARAQA